MVNQASAPTFSVIIATYNWSDALRIAIESVLDQTDNDFEVLVIGDQCTDNSEEVVRALGDSRITWTNLERNCGSQWGPNNAGLALAKGKYIAYLGHDDLWSPTHLQAARDTFERTGADIVAAGCLLYGPSESGVMAMTGFFPNKVFTPRHFFPPSSLLHLAEVANTIGGWIGPDEARHAVDYDFIVRCQESGASFAMTGEVSVFKFNAAWRRNSYQHRDVTEQRNLLVALRKDYKTCINRELTRVLQAATEDRLLKIETPLSTTIKASVSAAINKVYKRPHRSSEPSPAYEIDGPLCFPCINEYAGFEWHHLETHSTAITFRWTGPSTKSVRVLPVCIDRPMTVGIRIIDEIKPELLSAASLSINGIILDTTIEAHDGFGYFWRGNFLPDQIPANDRKEMRISISVPTNHRPIDLDINDDRRWLGLAVSWIEISPIDDGFQP